MKYTENKEGKGIYCEGATYNTVVSVQGFGFSGSGAVLDLLCEVDNCEVVGTVVNRSSTEDHQGIESDFLRLAGGLFEFEKYIEGNNVFQNDAMVKRFVKYIESFPPFRKSQKVQEIFFDFFEKIVDFKINLRYSAYNPHLNNSPIKKNDFIFFLRKMSLPDYRRTASELLCSLFNYININNKSILAFDQLFCDLEFDMIKYNEYVKGCKLIAVYRDPRDVYTYACNRNIDWIAHDNVGSFVKWYRTMVAKLDLHSEQYLVVQFERLVNNYDAEIKRIFEFLGISLEMHNKGLKQAYFIPENSKRGIGIWQKCSLPQADFDVIESYLFDYCYKV